MTDQAPPPASADGSPPPASEGAAPVPEAQGAPAPAAAGPGAGSPYRVAEVAPTPPAWTPSYAFLAVVSIVTLAADLGSKWWAKGRLEDPRVYSERHLEVIKEHLA